MSQHAHPPGTPSVEHIAFAGLDAAADIRIDPWGIAHLKAGNERDLFFLQGFNAARDRLWQIDLWRKRGLGLLAADFGPGFLAQDYASRLFLYRGDMRAEWDAYSPDAEMICTAFAAGINAFIDLTEREPERLPPEFALLSTRPQHWDAADVVRSRTHGMMRNATSEVVRAHVLHHADLSTDLLRKNIEPFVVPQHHGDVWLPPLHSMNLLRLASADVTFSQARLEATLESAWDWSGVDDENNVVQRHDARPPPSAISEGSNNWAISGTRTHSGRPIVANDPHRVLSLPSLRYLVHLTAPGFDAIGAGEPFLPGISIGHNGTTAFGLTIFYIDQEDVCVYETDPADPERCRIGDEYEPMQHEVEHFTIKDAEPVALRVSFTRHGPVVFADHAAARAIAVRTVWSLPGASPYARSLHAMRASSAQDFMQRVHGWGTPSVNHVCADVKGNFGWIPAGFTPERITFDGLTPVSGALEFDWHNLLDPAAMPTQFNPAKGYVATANTMNLPEGFPHRIGYEWIDDARLTRIEEVMSSMAAHRLEDSNALQTDLVSIPARRIQILLASQAHTPAQALLAEWDCRLAPHSAAAALYGMWWLRYLRPALMRRLVPDDAVRALLGPGDVATLLEALERPDARFGDDPVHARDALLAETLSDAWQACTEQLGHDSALWRWDALQHMIFEHGLSPLVPPETQARLNIGPLSYGGDYSTPMHAATRPRDFRITHGASVRVIIDVGNWDASRCINAPGQSGNPRSPHYGDLAPLWARGDTVPMLYSRAAVEEQTIHQIVLTPALR